MAWDAEGLRGNVANENETMVTLSRANVQGAKWERFCTGGHDWQGDGMGFHRLGGIDRAPYVALTTN
jgi:hypothetical protein